ncbi:MAG: low molecular weight protein arginine phosphatase [Candidatus Eisenbacteria bacterium]|nr:low molecular weight protein arginine phosphatase [Candidatus Eisenbacteria bacterium]
MRVLIVCTGNQCRSPMAEGLLRTMLAEATSASAASTIEVTSAGTGTADGHPATEEAVAVCREAGIDIAAHRSRAATAELVASSDLILAMQAHHVMALRALRPDAADRIQLLAAFAGEGEAVEVPDPIGQGLETYRQTFSALRGFLQRALPRLRGLAGEVRRERRAREE